MQELFIVYYVFINPHRNWKDIVLGQLKDIINSQIMNDKIYLDIVLSCKDAGVMQDAANIIDRFLQEQGIHNYQIIYADDNSHFEYPGILQLYRRGQSNPNAYILYLHTKGMVYNNSNMGRSCEEMRLTHNIIHAWQKVVQILHDNEKIAKVTIACSKEGWGWYNFFWCKGSYLQNCKEPIKTSDRYYYESWLGYEGSNTYEDCYNLIFPEIKYYDPNEANVLINYLKIKHI
jgi:hypothetical protein